MYQQKTRKPIDTQKGHQNFDYTTIADRLRTVSWSNTNHPTGVVKPVNGYPTFPLTTKAVLVLLKDFDKLIWNCNEANSSFDR